MDPALALKLTDGAGVAGGGGGNVGLGVAVAGLGVGGRLVAGGWVGAAVGARVGTTGTGVRLGSATLVAAGAAAVGCITTVITTGVLGGAAVGKPFAPPPPHAVNASKPPAHKTKKDLGVGCVFIFLFSGLNIKTQRGFFVCAYT